MTDNDDDMRPSDWTAMGADTHPGRWGGPRRGSGRKRGYSPGPFKAGRKRQTAWFPLPKPDTELPEPARASADVTLGYCFVCGATWHEPYTVVWWAAKASDSDAEWPILHEQHVQGQNEQHKPGCPATT